MSLNILISLLQIKHSKQTDCDNDISNEVGEITLILGVIAKRRGLLFSTRDGFKSAARLHHVVWLTHSAGIQKEISHKRNRF